jgi:hypothetical protein
MATTGNNGNIRRGSTTRLVYSCTQLYVRSGLTPSFWNTDPRCYFFFFWKRFRNANIVPKFGRRGVALVTPMSGKGSGTPFQLVPSRENFRNGVPERSITKMLLLIPNKNSLSPEMSGAIAVYLHWLQAYYQMYYYARTFRALGKLGKQVIVRKIGFVVACSNRKKEMYDC